MNPTFGPVGNPVNNIDHRQFIVGISIVVFLIILFGCIVVWQNAQKKQVVTPAPVKLSQAQVDNYVQKLNNIDLTVPKLTAKQQADYIKKLNTMSVSASEI